MSQPIANLGAASTLSEVARLIRGDFKRRAQHLGLTQPQWRVLISLSKSPGINQATLAEILEVHPVTVTQIVDRLVKAGWVRRAPHASDRRAVSLHLTESAEPLLLELNEVANQVREAALAGLKKSERSQLESLLLRIKCNLIGESSSSSCATPAQNPNKKQA